MRWSISTSSTWRAASRRAIDLGGKRSDYIYRVAWFPDGKHLAVQRQPRDLQSLELLKCAVSDGTCRRLLRETSDIWIELQDNLTFLEGSEEFIWSSRRSGYEHLYLYDWDGKLIRRLTAGEWEVVGSRRGNGVLGVDETRRAVLFLATEASPLERHLYEQSLDTDNPKRVTRITKREGCARRRPVEGYLAVRRHLLQPRPAAAGEHSRRPMAGASHGWKRTGSTRDIPTILTLPPTSSRSSAPSRRPTGRSCSTASTNRPGLMRSKRYPALVYVYGGPTGQTVTRSWGRTNEMWLQFMAQRGYAVFTVDNRGTGFRGAAFDAPIYRRLGRIEVEDQLTGLDFLQGLEWIDDDRVGVFGWSYGGYMTLMMVMQAPGRFAAGVSGAPVTDWHLYDTYYTERFLGHPDENGEGYEHERRLPVRREARG